MDPPGGGPAARLPVTAAWLHIILRFALPHAHSLP